MRRGALLLFLVPVLATAAAPASPAAPRPLVTAVADSYFERADGPLMLQRIRAAGARAVRLYVTWREIAPDGTTRPAGFDARNHADSNYRWAETDLAIQRVVSAGMQPIVTVSTAPDWAEHRRPEDASLAERERIEGTIRPDAAEYGAFAEAIARRYSGEVPGLPRVRYFQAWNEPNHHNDLNPQFDVAPDQPASADSPLIAAAVYRDLLEAFTTGVHRVRADNLVVAGGLAPFFRPAPGGRAAPPLTFMRELLCLDARNRPRANCPAPLRFDVWGQHPYTSGDARHSANAPHDVSLGDLPEVRRVLDAAVRSRRVIPRRTLRFWITEFSWDSSPPDPYGVPDRLLTRWVAEALNAMWLSGVDLVTWFQVRDAVPPPHGVFQSGLYRRCAQGIACDQPKPMLAAFRFPFVAYRSGAFVRVWGRTPAGRPATVVLEQRLGGRWVRLASIRSDAAGIIETRRLRRRGGGDIRARAGRDTSPAFSLRRVADRPVNPFGNVPVDERPRG